MQLAGLHRKDAFYQVGALRSTPNFEEQLYTGNQQEGMPGRKPPQSFDPQAAVVSTSDRELSRALAFGSKFSRSRSIFSDHQVRAPPNWVDGARADADS
jgi:hypothetical protein|eukprot:SAG25_NODE_67_length_17436_cov_89.239257_13_plen_99_part_00